ncbi:DUF397 domain-containing protein [Streptomyces sp. KLOTTS4A1]|uniref:DUF397 domain-containing protein n=1 Tax=Streptomyces sp. KLOTTS4A1 TaxID=3390996 RepID=UPI0039F4D297
MHWQKSSYCGEGESCVHVASEGAAVLLKESSDPRGAVLRMRRDEFAELLGRVKAGAHDPRPTPDGTIRLGPLTTTTPKWDAFRRGVRNGEFDHFATCPDPGPNGLRDDSPHRDRRDSDTQ